MFIRRPFNLILLFFFGMLYAFGVQANEIKKIELTNKNWISLSSDPENKRGISYLTEAMFGTDIQLPDVTTMKGKAKFIEEISERNDFVKLGYLIEIEVASLDLEKIPKKYKEEKVEIIRGDKFTILPIEQVVYEISFVFSMKDTDGFVLGKVESKKHDIYSDKINRFQDIVSDDIPIKIANRIKTIVYHMVVRKCVTCD